AVINGPGREVVTAVREVRDVWDYVEVGGPFFFSSRRRHTRSLRDWSSDVCSSDLALPTRHRSARSTAPASSSRRRSIGRRTAAGSEERRVGKECRSRGAADHCKKKSTSPTSPSHIADVLWPPGVPIRHPLYYRRHP